MVVQPAWNHRLVFQFVTGAGRDVVSSSDSERNTNTFIFSPNSVEIFHHNNHLLRSKLSHREKTLFSRGFCDLTSLISLFPYLPLPSLLAVQDQQGGQCHGCHRVPCGHAGSLPSLVSGLQLLWRWVRPQSIKGWPHWGVVSHIFSSCLWVTNIYFQK